MTLPYSANRAFFIFGSLIGYLLAVRRPSIRVVTVVVVTVLVILVYSNTLPYVSSKFVVFDVSNTVALAHLHLPILLWANFGALYIGKNFLEPMDWLRYLSYCGDIVIYTAVLLLGGIVLTVLAGLLLYAVDIQPAHRYLEQPVVLGAVSAPLIATHLVTINVVPRGKIAPLLAAIFSPLFLATLTSVLVVLLTRDQNPFPDRTFLLVFNVMLLVVLAIVIFVVTELPSRQSAGIFDYCNLALFGVTLWIDAFALVAILSRLDRYGLSPNRFALSQVYSSES